MHFTVSKQHLPLFLQKQKTVTNTCRHESITFSIQKTNTDTLCQDSNGQWLKNDQQDLVLRPGGHGSLIHNLNQIKSDFVFIKNIDNICHENHQKTSIFERKVLLGFVHSLQTQIHQGLYFTEHPSEQEQGTKKLKDIYLRYFKTKNDPSLTRLFLQNFFQKPLRVCGVVSNTQEPGGGPFWVSEKNGEESLQIVEESQINLNEKSQKDIFQSSTHFNPVFIAAGLKDHHNNSFNLLEFQNLNNYILTQKNVNGQDATILEWPGLWNGAMGNWNTLFVEIPLETFNPVKEIQDLLKPAHQS